jgi:hypothetical protein
MKTLTNSGNFTGSRIILSNSGGTSKRNGTTIQTLKQLIANHLPVVLKSNTETSFNFF